MGSRKVRIKVETKLLILIVFLRWSFFDVYVFWHHKVPVKILSTFYAALLTDNLGPQGEMKKTG